MEIFSRLADHFYFLDNGLQGDAWRGVLLSALELPGGLGGHLLVGDVHSPLHDLQVLLRLKGQLPAATAGVLQAGRELWFGAAGSAGHLGVT